MSATFAGPPLRREAAPAKLNLYLHVVGRRGDGYHLLDSLVAFAELGDVVDLSPADRTSLAVEGPFAVALAHEQPADNLAWRALDAFYAALSGERRCWAIRLTKNLPVAAGIGGGSSDAAAVLRALARCAGVASDDARLAHASRRLGADVPVCLAGRTSFVGGTGEDLAPAPSLPAAPLVLVHPRVALPTAAVFAARRGPDSAHARFAAPPPDVTELAALIRERRNDLTTTAVELVPPIADVLAALETTSGCLVARMSGSGATCFGLYASDGEAADAAAQLRARHPGWWTTSTKLLC